MEYPKLIDNKRVSLAETLKNISPYHKKLSIATGYWDLAGTVEILDSIKDYDSIRLLIGNEPLSNRIQRDKLDFEHPENLFPDDYFKSDLIYDNLSVKSIDELNILRNTVKKLVELINEKKLIVKVFRKKMLHAKAYIFGDYSDKSIGIVGSSNFTKAGLTSNYELNALQDNYMIINYKPNTETQENGYLSWFDEIWNDPDTVIWNGDFKNIIQDSPFGDLTFGNYDSYIKTLMEVYPDELIPPFELEQDISDILYSFQNRNAGILINKLEKNGVAILADSVGLGKTITAGSVIKHYLKKNDGKSNILVITPAALKQQWKDDLASILKVDYLDKAYDIVSEQDINEIQHIYDEYEKEWRTTKNIDLFVIDEAHNLRNKSGTRYEIILKLLQQHVNSHILLLTATPINNSLMDIANQIQLALKGKLKTINVTYIRPDGSRELLDFNDALYRIQSLIKKAEREGSNIEELLKKVKPTIHEGLKHFLVRSTRQGVEAEGGIINSNGIKKKFPVSKVESINYMYNDKITDKIYNLISKNTKDTFENIDPRKINLNIMSEFTQITSHPLDFLNKVGNDTNKMQELFDIEKDIFNKYGDLFFNCKKSLITNLLQIVFILGFVPYRPEVYNYKYYGKKISEINALNSIPQALKIQLTVHNILQITWLKRLESSPAALRKSVINYKNRIKLFKKYLDKGFIVSLEDANLLEAKYNYGEDIEQAFFDYETYLKKKEELLNLGKNLDELKKDGIEKKVANPNVYNIDAINLDISRDLKIINLLEQLLTEVSKPENDIKMHRLVETMMNAINNKKYGKKVLVFSFFADTINSLKDKVNEVIKDKYPNFINESEFITGNNSNVEKIVSRFSPKSKKYNLSDDATELNILFSTDVLSEGQNLQDSGFLINYDLHWNPVRMIQRNGRINRLGSEYDEVCVANMKPTEELEMYLNLVHRLETKINTIKNTIGLDQGILSSTDVNPIEFIEKYYKNGVLPEPDDDLLAYTDEHIIELRKFLGKNKNNQEYINKIKNMPIGKWNYLPKGRLNENESISMIRTYQTTNLSNLISSDVIFIKTIHNLKSNEYMADYIDYTNALDLIKTTEDDNIRQNDNIKLDRLVVKKRSFGEAKRQANNPNEYYKFTPQYEKALYILSSNYLQKNIDYKGILEKGVKTSNSKNRLEELLRSVKKEYNNSGSLNASTVNNFIGLFNEIKKLIDEEKEISKIEGVLFYGGK